MRSIRLSAKFIDRLVVLAFLILPVVIVVGYSIAFYAGAHGSTGAPSFADVFRDSFLYDWGYSVINEPSYWGFEPVMRLFRFIDSNMLHIGEADESFMLSVYGYMYYAFHVILFDLMFHIATFFVRLIKNMLNKLEGSSDL